MITFIPFIDFYEIFLYAISGRKQQKTLFCKLPDIVATTIH